MSNQDNKSILEKMGKDENKDAIPNRIQFAKILLQNNNLKTIIDFDSNDTDFFINKSKDPRNSHDTRNDEDSAESYDTRITLKKKILDITDIITNMGGTIKYVKSGTTGHTFKGEYFDKNGNLVYEYAVKVVAYSIKDKYGDMYDTRRPENAELMMIRLLSYFIVKKKTPHIVLPIGTFDTDITNFTNLIKQGYVSKSDQKYKEFVDRYNAGEYYDKVSVLISEWANRGDFLDFIKKKYREFTPIHWKVFFFQLISTLAVIQSKFPSFRHNDLKANNILVTKISQSVVTYKYTIIGNVYKVPNIGYQLKLWDFDFACIPGIVENKKVMISNSWSRGINVGPTQNRYYDIHYFFNTLIKKGFFPELMTDPRIDPEIKRFIESIVPSKYQSGDSVSKKGRILHNVEYTTPASILKSNPYFDEFRRNTSNATSIRKSGSKTTDKTKNNDVSIRRSSGEPQIDNFLRGGSKIEHASAVSNRIKSRSKLTPQVYTYGENKARTGRSIKKSKSKSKTNIKTDTRLNTKQKTRSKTRSKTGQSIRSIRKSIGKSIGEIDIEQLLMGI